MNRSERRKRNRCKYFTQPYKNARTRRRAYEYYWPDDDTASTPVHEGKPTIMSRLKSVLNKFSLLKFKNIQE